MIKSVIWILIIIFTFDFGVCCVLKRSPVNEEEFSTSSAWQFLNHDVCGLSNSDRIVGGKNANIGQYPWIARIGYSSPTMKGPSFRCGGTVISDYYVVTAAHCVIGLSDGIKLSRIRLGDHNTDTNPDCDGDFCNDPYQDYFPSKIIEHECYNQPPFRNDIALIRVSRKIDFSEFVRPICMMRTDQFLHKNLVGTKAEVSGWGISDNDLQQMTVTLQTVKVPIQENSVCVDGYKKIAAIAGEQMCVGGEIGKDSCGGDSGGPLVQVQNEGHLGPRYYLIGVVSFGAKYCGKTSLPGIYTRISFYMPWILKHLEA